MRSLLKFSKKLTRLGQSAAMLIAIAVATIQPQPALAAGTVLAPGDIAFTGYITNGDPDSFSFITLVPLSAGTEIYFTDNGWTGSNFFGITETNADVERLTRFAVNNPIAPGTIIRSNDVSLNFTWTVTGTFGVNGRYQELGLGANADQIAAVQSTNSANPLFSGFTGLAQIDYTGAFEPAVNNNTGDILPGLSQANGTAILFNGGASYAAFNLNTLASGTPAQWRTAISNPANWTFNNIGTSLPTGAVAVQSPAAIVTQPANQTIDIDASATLSVTVSGSAPITYKWYQGSTGDESNPIDGATTATFTTPALATTTNYWVRVSNSLATVDSATVTVTVTDLSALTNIVYLPVVNR